MKRKITRATIICLSLILLLGVVGCMRTESNADKMVAYMNEKYDDRFEYAAPFGGGPGATSTQITVKSEKFPDAEIWVEYYTENGKDVFADNYVDYKFEVETRDLLQKMLEEAFECDVILGFGVGTKGTRNSFTDETTFEDYIGSVDAYIGFNAVVRYGSEIENKDQIEERFLSVLDSYGIIANGSVYFAQTDETFKAFDTLSAAQQDSLKCLSFNMSGSGRFSSCEWR